MIYRKRGSVVRYENGFIVRSSEAGEAIDNGEFRCAPIEAEPLAFPTTEVEAIARRITAMGNVERLIVSEGIAEHECDGIRWTEQTKRVHVSFTRGALRVLVDLADFELDDVQRAADALAQSGRDVRSPRVRLAPNLGAALLPSLIGKIELWQSKADHDGKGLPVLEQKLTGPPWPNWWRPSYRTRPVRMPLNLRAVDSGEMEDAPRAVALLAPVAGNVLHVLSDTGDAMTIAVETVLAVRTTNRWYPYAGGSFGAELLV